MKPRSADTPAHVERIWIEAVRALPFESKFRMVSSLTSLCWRGARDAVRDAHPDWPESRRDLWLLTERYGADLATKVVEKRRQLGHYDHER